MNGTDGKKPLPRFTVHADHPSLADHFPGNPIVPGALVLDALVEACEDRHPELRVLGVSSLKFKSQLKPDITAEIVFSSSPRGLAVKVMTEDGVIAEGILLVESGPENAR